MLDLKKAKPKQYIGRTDLYLELFNGGNLSHVIQAFYFFFYIEYVCT